MIPALLVLAAQLAASTFVTPDPCAFLSRAELVRITRWTITGVERKTFHLPMGSGSMCAYQAKEGAAVVMVPDGTSAFLGTSPMTDPDSNGLAIEIRGFPAYVYAANGTVFMEGRHGGRAVSVRLTPNDAPPTLEELTDVARIVVPRLSVNGSLHQKPKPRK